MKNKPVENITREQAVDMIRATKGTFFTVKFFKASGEVRVLTGRTAVTKGLVGGQNTTAHIPKYLKVWDRNVKQYRNVNSETVYEVHTKGKVFVVADD